MFAGTVGSTPARDPRETSRQLNEWLNKNFADMGAIVDSFVGKHLPTENLAFPAIHAFASTSHATQYKRAPRRTWPDATPVQDARLREIWAEQDVDGIMAKAQASSLGQQMALIGLLPSREHAGRYSLTSWIRADVEWVDMGDAPEERDIRYARSVRIMHPWRQPDGSHQLVSLVFERAAAYYETPAGRVGVYNTAGTNPFAPLLPLMGARFAESTVAGEWCPDPDDGFWSAQVLACCVPSDVIRQIQVMSPGLQVLSGQGVASLAGKEGTFVNVLGLVQRFQLAIVPPPIVRTDLEVLLHLGKRWGVFDTKWTAKDVFERMKGTVPGYAGLEWDSPALVGTEPPVSPVSAYDALLERRLENPAEVLALAAEAAGAAPAGGEK